MIDKMGDRLKYYEGIEAGRVLIPHLPICVRVDGRAFHTFTRGMERPYDIKMSNSMIETMKYLVEKTDACIGYVQSDEISLILSDVKDPMFGGRVQKLTSVIASMATAKFNQEIHKFYPDKPLAEFDCRVWNVPSRTEAANTILWREFDATKNSIYMAARAYYSDKQLLNRRGGTCPPCPWKGKGDKKAQLRIKLPGHLYWERVCRKDSVTIFHSKLSLQGCRMGQGRLVVHPILRQAPGLGAKN